MAMSSAQLNQKLSQAHLDNQNRLRNLNREHESNIKSTKENKEDLIAQKEANHTQSTNNVVKAYESRIRTNGERFQLAMSRSNIERNKALQEQKEFYEDQIIKQKQGFQSELDNIQKDFANTSKLNNIKMNNSIERQQETDTRVKVSHNNEKQKISEHYKDQIRKLEKAHQKEVHDLKRSNKA